MPVLRPDLDSDGTRLARPLVTRFAPSPTGYLHLGHVVNAVYVWGVARAAGGSVLVRIEDHDRVRCRPEFEDALLEDLTWLGFQTAGDAVVPGSTVTRQSDESELYEEALRRLRSAYRVYSCDCSRTDIGGERYGGRCRERGLPERPGTGLRVEIGPGVERFDDLLLGTLEQSPADQCGDLLIRDRTGHWTYQFAVSVDDGRQGVTLVVRGVDLVSSTGRQLRLARMLSDAGAIPHRAAPAYLHHPLIFGADGHKLSKSTGAAAVRAMRDRGVAPEQVIGMAAAAIGLIPAERPVPAGEVTELFARRDTTMASGGDKQRGFPGGNRV